MNKKVVLITGASTGIGHATAKKFLEKGHIVYGFARRENLMEDLKKLGGHMFKGDVRDDKSINKIISAIINREGKIDILINNAAYAQYGSIEDVTIMQAKDQFETNVYGYIRTIKAVLPYMRQQKSGKIINLTSTLGKISIPIVAWYASSKHALESLLDSLRNEIYNFNIKVVIIEPGFIDTDLYQVAWKFLDKVNVSKPYKKMTSVLKKDFLKRQVNAPGPEIIADKIYNVSMLKNPKARYALPKDAKIFLFLNWLLPDKISDRIFRNMFEE